MQTDEWMNGWLVALWSAKMVDFDFDFESDADLLNCIGCACVRACVPFVSSFSSLIDLYWHCTIKLIKHFVKRVFAQQHYRMHFLFWCEKMDMWISVTACAVAGAAGVVAKFKNKMNASFARMKWRRKTLIERKWLNILKKVSQMNRMLNSIRMSKFIHLLESIMQICWYRRAAKAQCTQLSVHRNSIRSYRTSNWNQKNIGQSSCNANRNHNQHKSLSMQL